MRALKVLVVAMGVLIVLGTVGLVVALVQRAGGGSAGARVELALDLPDGARVAGIAATGDTLAVWVQQPGGERVLLVDPKRGRVTGEIRPGR